MVKCKRFDNGLRLVVKEVKGMYSVSTAVMVNVGSSLETEHTNGYSHLIEHMLFKGTPKYTALQISEVIDNVGGQLNAYTSKDTTCFFTKTSGEDLEISLDLLSDIFFNSLFDKDELEKEKKVVAEEILMCEDTPDDVCHDLIASTFYGNVALGQPILGPVKNITSATREKLLDFMNEFYTVENMCISIAGNVNFDFAVKLVEKLFLPHSRPTTNKVVLEPLKTFSKFASVCKDVEQAHISIAFKGIGFDESDVIPLTIFSNAFGGGMSSRLFQVIREQNGLAYTVYSYSSFYINNGYLELYLGTNPTNTEKALKLLKQEIDKVLIEGITESEFARGKAQLKGAMILAQENTMNLASSYGSYLLKTDKLFDVEKRLMSIDNVTKEEVDVAMRKVLNVENMSLAYVGKKCNENIFEILK